jgi:RNA polymerase sigma factor (sigma-70 family)
VANEGGNLLTAIAVASDMELLDRTQRGDQEAYGQLVARHQAAVCAVAYSLVGDVARSEDVAQEAFITAWQHLAELRDAGRFKPWLCGIARNMALALLRSHRKCRSLDTADMSTMQPSPEDQAVSNEELALVWNTLESLPQTYREPLVLFYREELSVARVAEALELSIDAVKQRLSRGREMLRDEIAGGKFVLDKVKPAGKADDKPEMNLLIDGEAKPHPLPIPASAIFNEDGVYEIEARVSGVIPGAIMTVIFMLTIILIAWWRPAKRIY